MKKYIKYIVLLLFISFGFGITNVIAGDVGTKEEPVYYKVKSKEFYENILNTKGARGTREDLKSYGIFLARDGDFTQADLNRFRKMREKIGEISNRKHFLAHGFEWGRVINDKGALHIHCINKVDWYLSLGCKYVKDWNKNWTDWKIIQKIDECTTLRKHHTRYKPIYGYKDPGTCPGDKPKPSSITEKSKVTIEGCKQSKVSCGNGKIEKDEQCEVNNGIWPDGCNPQTCKTGDLNPSLIISKIDYNKSDLDEKIGTNDSQTVKEGNSAVFKIKILNNGNESIKDIKLTDTGSIACSGLVLVENGEIKFPTNWSGAIVGGSVDYKVNLLEPGEYYEYICKDNIVSKSYTNFIKVTGVGNTSNKNISSSDTSKVIIDIDNGPLCGTADGYSYYFSDKDWQGRSFCSQGVANPNPPTFPEIGKVSSWVCKKDGKEVACLSDRTRIKDPGLQIEKKDSNPDDLDLISGNDVQVVKTSDRAEFRIIVRNNLKKDLNNVRVVDEKSPNCNKNIGELLIGEVFEYECKGERESMNYINNAKVTGYGDGEVYKSNDRSSVVVISNTNLECKNLNVLSINSSKTDYRCLGGVTSKMIGIDCDGDGDIDLKHRPKSYGLFKYADFECPINDKAACYVSENDSNVTTGNITSDNCKYENTVIPENLKCDGINFIKDTNGSSKYTCFGNILSSRIGIDCDGDGRIDDQKVANWNGDFKFASFICPKGSAPRCYVGKYDSYITKNSTTSPACKVSGGGRGICGDGIIQRPNSQGGKMEECESINGVFPVWCDKLDCKTDDFTIPGGSISNDDSESVIGNDLEDDYSTIPGGAGYFCNFGLDTYADGKDTNTVSFKVSIDALDGDIQGDSKLANLGMPTDIVDLSMNFADTINNIGDNALEFTPVLEQDVLPGGKEIVINIAKVTSVAPLGSCDNKLSFRIPGLNNGRKTIINNVGYYFKKPYIGELSQEGGSEISLGTKLSYELKAKESTWRGLDGVGPYKIDMSRENLFALGKDIELQSIEFDPNYNNGPYKFEARINSSNDAKSINNKPGIEVDKSVISYNFKGKDVRYYLTENDEPDDENSVKIYGSEFRGVRVIGGIKGVGKLEFTGQDKNISDISSSSIRTKIRKAAYKYISNMEGDGRILNNVKFVKDKDIKLSGNISGYETLVVLNGNVIIEGDLNTNNKNFGIIVLKDNFNVNKDYNYKGNVYVNRNVGKINAIIYADGGFISSDYNGEPYVEDTVKRTNELQRQLYMNGSLFTRNTIGGAIYKDGYYLLPGGIKTYGDYGFDKAMIYDLNYIRRGIVGCDNNGDGDCDDSKEYNSEGFIIEYNSRVQTDPPKLF